MDVPDYQSLMLPLLRYADEKVGEISTSEAVESLTVELSILGNHTSKIRMEILSQKWKKSTWTQ